MRVPRCILPAFLAMLVCVWPAKASHITFLTRTSTVFRNGQVSFEIWATNKGDEPAMSVWAEAICDGASTPGKRQDALGIDETYHAAMDLGRAPQPPGTHTIAIKVHYADGNGHPFTTLTSTPLTTANMEPEAPRIVGRLAGTSIRNHGHVTLSLTNNWNTPLSARLRLVLPGEIVSKQPATVLDIPPGSPRTVKFPVRNTTAVAGSLYSVFVIVDYRLNEENRSHVIHSSLRIAHPWWQGMNRKWSLVLIVPLLLLLVLAQFERFRRFNRLVSIPYSLLIPLLLFALLAFTLFHLGPTHLLSDTTTTGGDTPAHNYMASHAGSQLFGHGRIVSWAGGWWCGFPMFQYYFPLPYILMALLDLLLPFNLAFKFVSVLGMLTLPVCAYAMARMTQLPRAAQAILSIVMIPFLFVKAHTMWGVNVYSTLAGMIANSLSFSIMLLFLGSAYRDSEQGRFRIRTVLLLAAMICSHFFTSLMAALTLAILPLLKPRSGFLKSFSVLALEGLLGFLLMAWWIVPLVAKMSYSVDFGQDWHENLGKTFPVFCLVLFPVVTWIAVYAIPKWLKPVMLLEWMLLAAVFLFFFGSRISTVFDNIRLWPFIFFAVLSLGAIGLGIIVDKLKAQAPAIILIAVVALSWGIDQPNVTRAWANWNYSGLEHKGTWPVIEKLVLPLDGTPGRLANDLHHDNNSLGSSRVFETVPHLINKPILEGGIVNSALGSMFSYYVQGETSKNSAGFPNIVKPAKFDFDRATRHLELFNVKHFIARWPETKKALDKSRQWRFVERCQRWELYELLSHEGKYVSIPRYQPVGVRLPDSASGKAWKQAGLDWIYTIEALDQPFILLSPGEPPPPQAIRTIDNMEFKGYLATVKKQQTSSLAPIPTPPRNAPIEEQEISDNVIRFTTGNVGLPHIIKVSYFPNWQVTGADAVYMVTPCFMLVYPTSTQVELRYGYTASDNIGRVISLLGWIVLGTAARLGRRRATTRNADA